MTMAYVYKCICVLSDVSFSFWFVVHKHCGFWQFPVCRCKKYLFVYFVLVSITRLVEVVIYRMINN
jgi:hypothetical protein